MGIRRLKYVSSAQSKTIRICHVSTVHPADDSRVFWKESVSLAAEGYDVTLLARAKTNYVREGVKVIAVPTYSSRLRRMTFGALFVTRRAWHERPDVYHVHDPELVSFVIVHRLLGHRVVYDAHELLSAQVQTKTYLSAPFRRFGVFAAMLITKTLGCAANAIVTVNEAVAAPFPRSKTTVVSNFPRHCEFPPLDGKNHEQQPNLAIIYVGGVSRQRGITQLVEAMPLVNQVREVRLRLIGPAESPEYLEEISQTRGWEFVDYLGVVKHESIPGHLSGGLAGMVTLLPTPNHELSWPIKLFEYLAAGLPVVASDFHEWRRLVEGSACALFVNPESPVAIANSVILLADSPERCKEMGVAGRKLVLEKFTWESQVSGLESVYQALTRRSHIKVEQ